VIGVDAVVSLQEDSLPCYLGNSPDPILIGHWSTDEAARWVRDSNAVPNVVSGCLSVGAICALSLLAFSRPCLDNLP
jgi:hypothetical protein